MVERVALAAKPAAVRRGNDADVCRGQAEGFRERAVHVVRRLRARPEHQLALGILRRERGMLLDRQVGVALVEEGVLEDPVCRCEGLLDVAEP